VGCVEVGPLRAEHSVLLTSRSPLSILTHVHVRSLVGPLSMHICMHECMHVMASVDARCKPMF
jgi:hypothetical protein